MDYFSKNKILIGAIAVLVLMNVATLGTLWWMAGRQPLPHGKPGMSTKDFIVNELQFSDEQKGQFEQLRMQHRRAADEILEQLRESKRKFFALVRTPNVADSIVTKKSEEIGRLEALLDVTTLKHFQQIKAICNEQQREKFNSIVEQVLRMMNAPPPVGRGRPERGGPPPNMDRPPPPSESRP